MSRFAPLIEAALAVLDYADPRRRSLRWHTQRLVRKYGTPPWHRSVPWRRPYLLAAAEWIAGHVTPDAAILDAGCGLGHLFVLLHARGFRRFRGVDVEPNVVAAARDLLGTFHVAADVEAADAFTAIPASAPIDVLVTTNWHHAVAGGLSRLTTLAATSLAPHGHWLFDALYPPPPEREGFTPDEVARMVSGAGLRVVDAYQFHGRALYVAGRDQGRETSM